VWQSQLVVDGDFKLLPMFLWLVNQVGFKLNWAHQLLVCANDGNLLGDNMDAIKKNMETLIESSKKVGLEVKTQRKLSVCCCLVTRMQGKVTT
jgi:hypothetical protein